MGYLKSKGKIIGIICNVLCDDSSLIKIEFSKSATVSAAKSDQGIASVGIFLFLCNCTTEIHVVAMSVVLVLLLYNQPNFAC